jgi:hypothetical protein
MAVINRNTLVLNNVRVVRDVVTGTMGNGLIQAIAQAATSPFSSRHSSQRYPQAGHEPGPRHALAGPADEDAVADRAGRPGCCSGVLVRRSPALGAGRTLPPGWSVSKGGCCPTAAWRLDRFTAGAWASAGMLLPGRFKSPRDMALRQGSRLWLQTGEARKPAAATRTGLKPVGGTSSASTRGSWGG